MRYLLFLLLPSVCFGQVLKSSGGGNALNISGGTTGDSLYQSAANTTAFLAAGTTNQVLLGGSSAPSWNGNPILSTLGLGPALGANTNGGTLVVKSTSTTATNPVVDIQNNSGTSLLRVLQNGQTQIGGASGATFVYSGELTINSATGEVVEINNSNATGAAYIQPNGGTVYLASPRHQFTANGLLVTVPTAQTIAAGNTVAADACGGFKGVSSGGAVTTDTTNTFTAPAAANTGCVLNVCNVGANNITLDNNANFKSAGGADVVLTPDDCVQVASNGTTWYQVSALIAN